MASCYDTWEINSCTIELQSCTTTKHSQDCGCYISWSLPRTNCVTWNSFFFFTFSSFNVSDLLLFNIDSCFFVVFQTNEMESDRISKCFLWFRSASESCSRPSWQTPFLLRKQFKYYYSFTAREKQKHLGTRFNRSGMDLNRASLTLPKKMKKPSPDTISLIDSTSSMESLSTAGLLGSKQLSSSLLNINEGGGTCQLLLGYFLIMLIKITFITNFNNVFSKHRYGV